MSGSQVVPQPIAIFFLYISNSFLPACYFERIIIYLAYLCMCAYLFRTFPILLYLYTFSKFILDLVETNI